MGCGNLGKALLRGWLKIDSAASYLVVKPTPLENEFKAKNIIYASKPDERVKNSDIIVVAVKPQMIENVLNEWKAFISPNSIIASTAAGWKISQFENILGTHQPVVRTLPNLASALNKGTTLAIANAKTSKEQRKTIETVFGDIGLLEWLESENLMSAASMISGAAPAFVFLLTEILAKAGENNGAPEDLARRAARQTIIGAAALMEDRADKTPESLRESVTSKAGITDAALKILMNGEMQKLFDQAIEAGKKRGDELAG